MAFLELGAFGVSAGEFAGESLVVCSQVEDVSLARVGLPAGSPGGGTSTA